MPHALGDTEGMRSSRSARSLLPLVLAAVLATSACAGATSPGAEPTPTSTDVVGQGTVIQTADDEAQLCLGAIAESYPPQCTGVPLVGWDWTTVGGQETSAGTTWGTYAVWGRWDGTILTVSGAIQLALYDPLPIQDPLLDPANAGTATEATLADVLDRIAAEAPVEVYGARIENGYVFVDVLHDDGTVQAWADARYGAGVVAVRSLLRDTSE
jgi:hypothetical protein